MIYSKKSISDPKNKITAYYRQKISSRTLFNRKERTTLRRMLGNQIIQHPPRILIMSFVTVIIFGMILLSLPHATRTTGSLPLLDCLFTSTSATCVTGLVVVDTGSTFSTFGQIVILTLVQIGGLGIMTFSTFFIFILSGRLGIAGREVLIDTLSQNPAVELSKLLKTVFLFTLSIEIIGWLFLSLRFMIDFRFSKAVYLGLFHSVSAFCNAGFYLFSDSFLNYTSDPTINIVMIILIILGGLGFLVIFDLYNNHKQVIKFDVFQLSLHSKVVLASTAILVISGFIFILIIEYPNSLKTLPLHGKIFASAFQSVTSRTAGFNTLSIEKLTNASLFILMIFMFIGASPGSCGGGIKTTTITLLILSIFNRFKMRERVNIFYRRIPDETLSRMISIVFFSIATITLFTILLTLSETPQTAHIQTRGQFMENLFEVVSAFGTVGLSTGITPTLTSTGKIFITILMFFGRLGPLTIALAINRKPASPDFKYLQEDVMVG